MKTIEEINELAYKRYGTDPHKFGGQRDGFKEGFKQAQESQLMQTVVVGRSEQDCDVCRPITEGFYLGGTCQKCLKPFREFKQS